MTASGKTHFMSGRVAALLVTLAAVATVTLILLFAFAPDLRKDQSSGTDALSNSAVGFAGLDKLLSLSGTPTAIDRGLASGTPSLTILTPAMTTSAGDMADYRVRGPVLIILPKWVTVPMRDKPEWVTKFSAAGTQAIQRMIQPLAGIVVIKRAAGSAHAVQILKGSGPPSGIPGPLSLPDIESVQTVVGGVALMTASRYGPLLAQARRTGAPVYILSDPDLMNNHGLSDETTALAAIAIIQALRRGNGPVFFDVTLDGLGRVPNLWEALFKPPFLGATISAFIAAVLIALHAMSRFGAPERVARVFANGKKALADNTASLIRMMGRERAMAQRYVLAARNAALLRLDLRRAGAEEQDRLLAALEAGAGLATSYAELAREADETRTGGDLLRVARKAYAWKQGITSGY